MLAKPKIIMAQVEGSGTAPTLNTPVNVPGPGKLLVVKVKVSPTSEKAPPAKLSETDVMFENALSFSVNTMGELIPLVIKTSVMMIWLLVISTVIVLAKSV